jgi:putative FmdB family regulatory protein
MAVAQPRVDPRLGIRGLGESSLGDVVPVFEYRCVRCGKVTEVFHRKLESNEDVICSHCGSDELEKLISAPARVITSTSSGTTTCCGKTERCDAPPCEVDGSCRRE